MKKIICEAQECGYNKAGECGFSGHLYFKLNGDTVYCAVYELQSNGGEDNAESREFPSADKGPDE